MNDRTKWIMIIVLIILINPLRSLSYSAAPTTTNNSTSYKQILAGNYYSVALRTDGTVWSWGRNLWGEQGVMETNIATSIAAPVRLTALSNMITIASNGFGNQVGLKADGTVWEWGQVTGISKSVANSVLPRQVLNLSDIVAVTVVNSMGFALNRDGSLFAWTHVGQVDAGIKVVQVPGDHEWLSMITNGDLAYALDDNGSIWVFGAVRKEDSVTIIEPYRLAGVPRMKQISASPHTNEMYGVDQDATAWMWKLDQSPLHNVPEPGPVKLSSKPMKVYPKLKIAEVQTGNHYGLLLTTQGEVWTNNGGPAGGKSGKVKGLTAIKTIDAGYAHSLALDSKGRIWGWGANNWNEVGTVRSIGDGMVYTPVLAQTGINVYVNGELLPSSFPSRMHNNLISVPLRDVMNALGGSVTFSTDYTFTVKFGENKASFQLGEHEVEINGKKAVIPSAAYGLSGVTMVPVTLLKGMGISATWNANLAELRLVTQ